MENTIDLEKLKYPHGPFLRQDNYSKEELQALISTISAAPALYRTIATNLSESDLLKQYRPGSWNVRQLIHHVADIQLLHFFRMKKALTEQDYKEVTLINMDAWVQTPDAKVAPTEDSLMMFESITRRFLFLVNSLDEKSLQIEYYHPIRKFNLSQAQAIAMCAWHVKHHLAHIKIALNI